jgi:hypothetical protein
MNPLSLPASAGPQPEFRWETHPRAETWLREQLDDFLTRNSFAAMLARRMEQETATRFFDWIDHIRLHQTPEISSTLQALGYERDATSYVPVYRHTGAIFPAVVLSPKAATAVAIKVDSVADFVQAHQLDVRIDGPVLNPMRKTRVSLEQETSLWAVERHGYAGMELTVQNPDLRLAAQRHLDVFRTRRRRFSDSLRGFRYAEEQIAIAIDDLGVDWTCSLFFQAEREYWQRRCKAGAIQKLRQDRLGLGWANHDHHTYRSSRRCFHALIRVFELLGFSMRERFTPSAEAGWGAQVIEQPRAGITIFADVDASPDEILGDFAHEPLPERKELGTVGLWCGLHGESFLEAGMHHLECQFDFSLLTRQLAGEGIGMMKPFSSFPHLKQAFSEGDIWPVDEVRLQALLDAEQITVEQAEAFRREGALGAHLENLERNAGFKGFNQSGIDEIIASTDPRLARVGG